MLSQGVYFLMHLWIICIGDVCSLTQTPIAVYRHPDICVIARDTFREEYPREIFYCTQVADA